MKGKREQEVTVVNFPVIDFLFNYFECPKREPREGEAVLCISNGDDGVYALLLYRVSETTKFYLREYPPGTDPNTISEEMYEVAESDPGNG